MNKEELWSIAETLGQNCQPLDLFCIINQQINALEPALRQYYLTAIRTRLPDFEDAVPPIILERLNTITHAVTACQANNLRCLAGLAYSPLAARPSITEIRIAVKIRLTAAPNVEAQNNITSFFSQAQTSPPLLAGFPILTFLLRIYTLQQQINAKGYSALAKPNKWIALSDWKTIADTLEAWKIAEDAQQDVTDERQAAIDAAAPTDFDEDEIDAIFQQYKASFRTQIIEQYGELEALKVITSEKLTGVTGAALNTQIFEVYQQTIAQVLDIVIDAPISGTSQTDGYWKVVSDSPPITQLEYAFYVLQGYRQGGEWMGQWLKTQFTLPVSDSNLVFRRVLAPITLKRITDGLSGIDDSFGYTVDHVVNDRFGGFINSNFRASDVPMAAELALHELTHVFLNAAGYGEFITSPINGNITLQGGTTLSDLAYQILNDNPNTALRTGNANQLVGDEQDGNAPNEVMTNFMQNLALGRLPSVSNGLPASPAEVVARFNRALSNNLLRKADPAAVLQVIDNQANINQRSFSGLSDAITFRYRPSTLDRPMVRSLAGQSGEEVVLLGSNLDNTWGYVMFLQQPFLFNFAWVSFTAYPPFNIPNLQPIDPNSVSPDRADLTTGLSATLTSNATVTIVFS